MLARLPMPGGGRIWAPGRILGRRYARREISREELWGLKDDLAGQQIWPPETASSGSHPNGILMNLVLFGYPKTGKTTLFNLLTGQQADTSKFTSRQPDLHQAITPVPDPRLDRLAALYQLPAVPAAIQFMDTGPVAYGDAKSSTFLEVLRKADGLVHVIRGFEDPEILHSQGRVDPLSDLKHMHEELRTTDYISVEARLEKLMQERKKGKDPVQERETEVLTKIKAELEKQIPLQKIPLSPAEDKVIRGFNFLTHKSLINLINSDDQHYHRLLKLEEEIANTSVSCLQIERELLELDPVERPLFEKEFGLENYRYLKDFFIKGCYRALGLISFFTIGDREIKAWTTAEDTSAYLAAGKIHSDIQDGFIRAEVIPWQDLVEEGGLVNARKKGSVRLEGKDYPVHDGDVIQFRFNR